MGTLVDLRGWQVTGDRATRSSVDGMSWEIERLALGWRLERDGWQDWEYGDRARFVSASLADCVAMADCVDRHDEATTAWLAKEVFVEREGPHGLHFIARKAAGDLSLAGRAFDGEAFVGYRDVAMESAEVAYVLGEIITSGSSSLEKKWIGKGVGAALYDFVDEIAGHRSTPHGRFGAKGILTDLSRTFWDKRARHTDVPGKRDPEGVEARFQAVERSRVFGFAERRHLSPDLAVALAAAIDGIPVLVMREGEPVGWAEAPDGRNLTTRGWDNVTPADMSGGKVLRGWDEVAEASSLLKDLADGQVPPSITTGPCSVALEFHHSTGWDRLRVLESLREASGLSLPALSA